MKARAVDEALKAAAEAINAHQDSLIDVVAAGAEPHIMHQAQTQYWLMPAIVAGGIKGLPGDLARSPQTLESYIRPLLG